MAGLQSAYGSVDGTSEECSLLKGRILSLDTQSGQGGAK